MTNETDIQNDSQDQSQAHTIQLTIGSRFKSARESLSLERKNIAMQLRLSESIIKNIEEDIIPENLPHTFLRGYIRAYGKLLAIPLDEIDLAIEPLKAKPVHQDPLHAHIQSAQSSDNSLYMQFFTFFIVVTMMGLVGAWWYKHTPNTALTDSRTQALPMPPSSIDSASEALKPVETTASKSPTSLTPDTSSLETAPVITSYPSQAKSAENNQTDDKKIASNSESSNSAGVNLASSNKASTINEEFDDSDFDEEDL